MRLFDGLAGRLGFIHRGIGRFGLPVDLQAEAPERRAVLTGLGRDRLGYSFLLGHAHRRHTRQFLIGPDRFPDIFIHLGAPVVFG